MRMVEQVMPDLRELLTALFPDTTVINCHGPHAMVRHGQVKTEAGLWSPIHAVIDQDGDTIGRGLTEDGAIFDAIKSEHEDLRRRFDELRESVIDKHRAEAEIAKIVGLS